MSELDRKLITWAMACLITGSPFTVWGMFIWFRYLCQKKKRSTSSSQSRCRPYVTSPISQPEMPVMTGSDFLHHLSRASSSRKCSSSIRPSDVMASPSFVALRNPESISSRRNSSSLISWLRVSLLTCSRPFSRSRISSLLSSLSMALLFIVMTSVGFAFPVIVGLVMALLEYKMEGR